MTPVQYPIHGEALGGMTKFAIESDIVGQMHFEAEKHQRLKPFSICEILALPPRQYLIKGLIGVGELSLWYGDYAAGKTFFLMEMCRCIATGENWFDRKTTPGSVLYILAEGVSGTGKRVEAMKRKNGLSDDDPFHVIPVSADISDPKGEDVESIIFWAQQYGTIMVVIDTVARAMHGDENSSRDMGNFIKCCDLIREETGAHVAVVHHQGKANGKMSRGSNALPAAADLVVHVESRSGGKTATVKKNKDDEDGWHVGFRLEVIEVGIDEDGAPITSCAVIPAEVFPTKTSNPLNGDKAKAMDALNDVLIKQGECASNTMIPDGVKCVSIHTWRQEFYSRKDGSEGAKQKAFSRAKTELEGMGKTGYRDEWVWAIGDGD